MLTTDGPSASSSLISDKLSVLSALRLPRCFHGVPGHRSTRRTELHMGIIRNVKKVTPPTVAARVQRANVAPSYARAESLLEGRPRPPARIGGDETSLGKHNLKCFYRL